MSKLTKQLSPAEQRKNGHLSFISDGRQGRALPETERLSGSRREGVQRQN